MSINVNVSIIVPLGLFSAIRHGGIDNLKPHELGHISSIATQALVEGSQATRLTSPPPADFEVTITKLKEKIKPTGADSESADSRSLHGRLQDSREVWSRLDPLATHQKLLSLQTHLDLLMSQGTLTAEAALNYLEGEIRAKKFLLPAKKPNTRLSARQKKIHVFLRESATFRHRISRYFRRRLHLALEKARIQAQRTARKNEEDNVYSVVKNLSNNPGHRRVGPVFESSTDAKEVALLMLLDYTLTMHGAQNAGHLFADQVSGFGLLDFDGIGLICERSKA